MTLEQLNKSNGLNGNKCLVAVDGNVYDASSNEQWRNGEHGPSGGQAKCGEDLSSLINQSPHGKRVLNKLPVIGILNT
ncbi:MAG: cytochrome B5 [Candidatus Nomurabacteria bacterium]|nr:MAG: cytochrome B5 [Candidatus Nomurabacteria bacterium]